MYNSKAKEKRRVYRKKNRAKIREQQRDYMRNWQRTRYAKDITFRMGRSLRSRVAAFLKSRSWVKSSSISKIVGCSPTFLRSYITQQFKPGMTADNYGVVWEIDHYIPLSSAKSEAVVAQLSHYTNLRPLFKVDNRIKGATMPIGPLFITCSSALNNLL